MKLVKVGKKINNLSEDNKNRINMEQIQATFRQLEADNFLKQQELMTCLSVMIGMETVQPTRSVFLSLWESWT